MRLDHLLSKEKVRVGYTIQVSMRTALLVSISPNRIPKIFGVDALRGNTRSHPEHDG